MSVEICLGVLFTKHKFLLDLVPSLFIKEESGGTKESEGGEKGEGETAGRRRKHGQSFSPSASPSVLPLIR